jgi:hypothetical protein
MTYRLLIDYEVIEFLETLSRKEQQLLRKHFIAILTLPRKFSDYTEPDSTGRRVDIHICGKFAIKFWEDHTDRHLKILDVHFADQSRGRFTCRAEALHRLSKSAFKDVVALS